MTAMLLYDGWCGFCSSSARALQRWVRPQCLVLPYQQVDLARWGVGAQQAAAEVVFVSRAGDAVAVTGGAAAVAEALSTGRPPWPAVAAVLRAPGVRWAAAMAYRAVAANRRHLPGGTPACALDGTAPVVAVG